MSIRTIPTPADRLQVGDRILFTTEERVVEAVEQPPGERLRVTLAPLPGEAGSAWVMRFAPDFIIARRA